MEAGVKISRVKETKRGRLALFSEEGFLFSVDSETYAKEGLEIGLVLGHAQLEALRQAGDTRKAKDNALRYLSLRAYGERELYAKLCQRYDEETCAAVMAQVVELGLVNDEAFAAEKAKGMAARGKSRREIGQKLGSLGVGRKDIELALAQLEEDGDEENALTLLRKSYRDKLAAGKVQQVMAALARRGFSHSTIKIAIEQAMEELEDE